MPRNQINVTLGTAGHIDHGKTALIKCLTGCDTDRLKEEKERGMSIELGYAACTLGSLEVGIVDVPGHEHFIRTMVAGASGIDACMLVVAADDGPMPQTREHLDILTLLDVRHGVVVLTKVDRLSEEEQHIARQVTTEFVRGTFLENAPVLPVSNVTGEGLSALYESLCDMVCQIGARPVDGVFRLPVERAFSIKGHGTVIAGVPLTGSARVDDDIVLLPDGIPGRIKSIQVYGQESDQVLAGQCAAINIRHWDHRLAERGKTLTVPGFFEPHTWCIGHMRMLPQDRLYLKHGSSVRFHTGTSERIGKVYMLEGEGLSGGKSAFVQFRFDEPIIAGPRDRFIVRALSPAQTIGGGVVIDTFQRRLNRTEPGLLTRISEQHAATADHRTLVEFRAEHADDPLIDPAYIAHQAKIPLAQATACLENLFACGKLIRAADGRYVHCELAENLGRRLLTRLAEYHQANPASPGLHIDELRQGWDTADAKPVYAGPTVLQAVVELLRSTGRITACDQRLALPDHRAAAEGEEAACLLKLEQLFQARAFNPPDTREIAVMLSLDSGTVHRLTKILLEHKRLIRVDRDLVFHADAISRARDAIINHVQTKGRLESVEFKYLVDTSRKFAIPLLDYFDRTGLTKRLSDNTRLLRT